MAIDFPANPSAQSPINTFSPTSTPDANTTNSVTFLWDGTKWTATGSGGGAAPLWQRDGGTSTLSPVTADDNINQGAGDITTTGDISGAAATFTGDLSAADGTFSGAVNVDDWLGGTTTFGARIGGLGHKFRADSATATVADFFGGPGNFSVVDQILRIKGTHLEIGGKDVGGGTIGWNAKFTRDGILRIGGTLTDATNSPNIELNPDGSATFETANGYQKFQTNGATSLSRKTTTANVTAFQVLSNVGGTDSIKFTVAADGTVKAKGTITGNSLRFELEPDDPANYTTTMVDGEEQQVYSGPTLDVKEKLLEFVARIEALEADNASLEARLTALEAN